MGHSFNASFAHDNDPLLPALLRFVSVGTSTSKDRVVYFMFIIALRHFACCPNTYTQTN